VSAITKLGIIILATACSSFAATINFIGPSFPPTQGGGTCTAADSHCVIGDPAVYEIFAASLTQPSGGNLNWTLTIQTNYGTSIPGSKEVVPSYLYQGTDSLFSMADFLISWNNKLYGIVLHAHDGYTAGNLYQVTSFETSQDVMGAANPPVAIPRPEASVKIAPGGTKIGNGTLSGAVTGDGVDTGKYTITDVFSAPADFLATGGFIIDAASYDCANGYLTGSGNFAVVTGGGGTAAVPEPITILLIVPALLVILLMRRLKRQ
jgi:hypothetical protein